MSLKNTVCIILTKLIARKYVLENKQVFKTDQGAVGHI